MKASESPPRPFYGRPFVWLLFALLLLLVPAVGYMADSSRSWNEVHPALNALLNGSASVFLIAGFVAIKRKNVPLHRQCMIAAFVASAVFLASYLVRFYLTGSHSYPGDGIDRVIYLTILMSHMVLAVVVLPMVLRSLFLGVKGRYVAHRRIARWTWPVWIYVSLTGVIVYLMLYPIASAVYGG
jgi:putative membrane protein